MSSAEADPIAATDGDLGDYRPSAQLETDAEFSIVAWNAAAERDFGWTSEEVLDRKIYDFILVASGPTSAITRIRLLQEQGSWEGVAMVRSKARQAVPAFGIVESDRDEYGEIIRYRSTLRMAGHLAEGWPRSTRLPLELDRVVDAHGVAVIRIDERRAVCGWSSGAERVFGRQAAAAVGHKLKDVIEGDLDLDYLDNVGRWSSHRRLVDRRTLSSVQAQVAAFKIEVGYVFLLWESPRIEPLYTLEHVAHILAVNEKTVRKMISNGEIVAYNIAHRWRFEEDDLLRFMADRRSHKMDDRAREALRAEMRQLRDSMGADE